MHIAAVTLLNVLTALAILQQWDRFEASQQLIDVIHDNALIPEIDVQTAHVDLCTSLVTAILFAYMTSKKHTLIIPLMESLSVILYYAAMMSVVVIAAIAMLTWIDQDRSLVVKIKWE